MTGGSCLVFADRRRRRRAPKLGSALATDYMERRRGFDDDGEHIIQLCPELISTDTREAINEGKKFRLLLCPLSLPLSSLVPPPIPPVATLPSRGTVQLFNIKKE